MAGKYRTRIFHKDWLLALLDEDPDFDGEILSDEVTGKRRWSVDHWLIFATKEEEPQVYGVHYSVGATECQDESPWEYDGDEIECTLLEPKVVQVTEYHPVKVGE